MKEVGPARVMPIVRVLLPLLGVVLAAAGGNGCDSGDATVRRSRLDLSIERVYTLPDSFGLAGITIAADDRIVAWAANQSHLVLLDPDGSIDPITLPTVVRPVGAAIRNDTIEIVDGIAGKLLTFADTTRLVSSVDLMLPGKIVAASSRGRQWIFLTSDPHDVSTLFLHRTAPNDVRAVPTGSDGPAHISSFDDRFLVRSRSLRTPLMLVDSSGALTVGASLADAPLLQEYTTDTTARWVAMHTLTLGQNLLTTVADANSTRRLLVVSDSSGYPLRISPLEAVISFIGASDRTNLVAAARRTDRQEVVVYRWSEFNPVIRREE